MSRREPKKERDMLRVREIKQRERESRLRAE
jgi:hypothetical protein